MINRPLCLLPLMLVIGINTQAQVGFELYHYVKNKQMKALVPILNYETRNHVYGEARYNYEEMNTFSFYLGRTFSNEDKLTYAFTPMLGGVMGRFKGGSAAVNAVVEYRKLFFSTQSQYTLAFSETTTDFFFAWSELGYQPWKWFYFGLSTQQTYLPETKSSVTEPGIMLGLSVGKWTFPFYSFNPMSSDKYFVLGINLTVGAYHRNR